MKYLQLKAVQLTSDAITGNKSFAYKRELLAVTGINPEGIKSVEEMEQRLNIRKKLQEASDVGVLALEDAEYNALKGWFQKYWTPQAVDDEYLAFMKAVNAPLNEAPAQLADAAKA